jgi:hypothetical protein
MSKKQQKQGNLSIMRNKAENSNELCSRTSSGSRSGESALGAALRSGQWGAHRVGM